MKFYVASFGTLFSSQFWAKEMLAIFPGTKNASTNPKVREPEIPQRTMSDSANNFVRMLLLSPSLGAVEMPSARKGAYHVEADFQAGASNGDVHLLFCMVGASGGFTSRGSSGVRRAVK